MIKQGRKRPEICSKRRNFGQREKNVLEIAVFCKGSVHDASSITKKEGHMTMTYCKKGVCFIEICCANLNKSKYFQFHAFGLCKYDFFFNLYVIYCYQKVSIWSNKGCQLKNYQL